MSTVQVVAPAATIASYVIDGVSGCTCQMKPCEHYPPRTDPFTANLLSVEVLRAMLVHMTGKVKTIIDAAISPTEQPSQNKAIKDLVHAALWDTYGTVVQWSHREADRIDGRQREGEHWPLKFGTGSEVPPDSPPAT